MKNGGLYIKLGQAVAACNNLFPLVYTTKLAELNDKALVSKEDDFDEIVMEDFGKSLNQMFSQVNREPIASASIAEVFKGTLKDSGKAVAIKVQFIELQDSFTGRSLSQFLSRQSATQTAAQCIKCLKFRPWPVANR